MCLCLHVPPGSEREGKTGKKGLMMPCNYLLALDISIFSAMFDCCGKCSEHSTSSRQPQKQNLGSVLNAVKL